MIYLVTQFKSGYINIGPSKKAALYISKIGKWQKKNLIVSKSVLSVLILLNYGTNGKSFQDYVTKSNSFFFVETFAQNSYKNIFKKAQGNLHSLNIVKGLIFIVLCAF